MSEKEMRERFEVWFGERYGALDASGAAMRANMWTAFQAGAQSAPRVPREPTVHMLDAAINNDDGPCTIAFAKTIWRAMYDAAPPEAAPKGETHQAGAQSAPREACYGPVDATPTDSPAAVGEACAHSAEWIDSAIDAAMNGNKETKSVTPRGNLTERKCT